MITVKIDEDEALDMLMDRVRVWTSDETKIELFEKMYDSYCYNGYFDEAEFNIMNIVDNDYINWCDVVEKDETNAEDFVRLVEMYNYGERDFSREHFETISGSFIEAINDDETAILIRY